MKIITIGNGFIASHLPYEIARYYLTSNQDDIAHFINRYKPDVIVNCIGRTGVINIDWCENHKTETYLANTTIPLLLAEQCQKNNIYLIHLSSGCCYSGLSPHVSADIKYGQIPSIQDPGFSETDFANPQSFYASTKYASDLVLGSLPSAVVLRIRMPISIKDHSRNLINKLKKYQQIIDIPNSMTFTSDLVRCIDWAVQNRPTGIFHVANKPTLTATQVMREYQKYVPDHHFDIISGEQLDQITKAKRSNCILNCSKLKNAGFEMSNSENELKDCMQQYFINLKGN